METIHVLMDFYGVIPISVILACCFVVTKAENQITFC